MRSPVSLRVVNASRARGSGLSPTWRLGSDLLEGFALRLLREEVDESTNEQHDREQDERRTHGVGSHILLDHAAADDEPHEGRADDLWAGTDAVAQAKTRRAGLVGELFRAERVEGSEGSIAEGHHDQNAEEEHATGNVVDQEALVEALGDGRVSFAGLDVFFVEPLPQDNPLWTMDNVLIAPHTAALNASEDRLIAELFARNATRLLRGEELINRVDTIDFF